MTRRALILACLLAGALFGASEETLTIQDYWRLEKARLELSATEWQARIDALDRVYGERKRLLARTDEITKDFATRQRKLHARFGMSPQTCLRYGSDHARELESYLNADENFAIRGDIEQLREKIKSLMQRFDALVEPILKESK